MSLALSACASHPDIPGQAQHTAADLLHGPVTVDLAPADILQPSPAMRRFVARHTAAEANPTRRLRQLIGAMLDEGLLNVQYDHGQTLSAAATFARRQGNCLSFTNLFVSLARSAGLPAQFQFVALKPRWNLSGDWLVLDRHINARVSQVSNSRGGRRHFVVDFSRPDYRGAERTQLLSDDQAFARYYSNRGAEILQTRQWRQAGPYLRQALHLDGNLAGAWINLGVLLARQGQLEKAVSAYHLALRQEPDNPAALSNLAQLYSAQGQTDLVRRLESRLTRIRAQNPYYHYQQARTAADSGRNSSALTHLKRAIALNGDDPEFFLLQARIAQALQQPRLMRRSLAQARDLSRNDDQRARLQRKLNAL